MKSNAIVNGMRTNCKFVQTIEAVEILNQNVFQNMKMVTVFKDVIYEKPKKIIVVTFKWNESIRVHISKCKRFFFSDT